MLASQAPTATSTTSEGVSSQRKQAEQGGQDTDRSAELEREHVQRGREYEERYAADVQSRCSALGLDSLPSFGSQGAARGAS